MITFWSAVAFAEALAGTADPGVLRLDASGRAVLVAHVPSAESVRIEVAFPSGYARADWPSLGAVYWGALDQCIVGADAWPLEATVEADVVRLSGIAPTAHLPELVTTLHAALTYPGHCKGGDVGRSLDRAEARAAATPVGRLRNLAVRELFAAGDPRRDRFGDGISRYADAVELESMRDRVVGLRGAVVTVVGACDGACALRATADLLPDPPWGDPPPRRSAPRRARARRPDLPRHVRRPPATPRRARPPRARGRLPRLARVPRGRPRIVPASPRATPRARRARVRRAAQLPCLLLARPVGRDDHGPPRRCRGGRDRDA